MNDKNSREYDIIIIGSGPAGYTAGIYASRAGYNTLIISGVLQGGQLMNTTNVENYPGFSSGILGPDLMLNMLQQCKNMGTEVINEEVSNVDLKHTPLTVHINNVKYSAKSIIICTGATPKKLGLPSEDFFSAKGVSYCATCDGAFFKNLELAVIGGGDSAMEEAIFLTKFASRVHVIHRRNEFRASKIMQKRAMLNTKIEFHLNQNIVEIIGDNKVRKILLKNTQTHENQFLDVEGVFIAIGHEPNTQLFKNQIDLDANGYIILKNKTETNIRGVFAAGDVHDHTYRQAITAAGFGCMAAIDVDKFLTKL